MKAILALGMLVVSSAAFAGGQQQGQTGENECLRSAKLDFHYSGFRAGAGFVFSKLGGHLGRGINLKLERRDGKTTEVEVYMHAFEIGVTAAAEAWATGLKFMELKIPQDEQTCVRPMDIFKAFKGTGVGVGATAGVGVDLEISGLCNPSGAKLIFGPGVTALGLGAHVSVLPFKVLKIKPVRGFMSLDERFFDRAEIDDQINGVRNMKW